MQYPYTWSLTRAVLLWAQVSAIQACLAVTGLCPNWVPVTVTIQVVTWLNITGLCPLRVPVILSIQTGVQYDMGRAHINTPAWPLELEKDKGQRAVNL